MSQLHHPNRRSIVIVGGGFAGVATAIRLIDLSSDQIDLSIVEPTEDLGRGIAFSTTDEHHLLNGPAIVFSLHPDRPNHLAAWVSANPKYRGWSLPVGATAETLFVPRYHYGSYVIDDLERALRETGGRVAFRHVRSTATDIVQPTPVAPDGGLIVLLDSGETIFANEVILATGLVAAKARLSVAGGLRERGLYRDDVWSEESYRQASGMTHVAILGSSLTALDAIVSLERAGFEGEYALFSRHGLIAQERHFVSPWRDFLGDAPLPTTVSALLARINRERRELARLGEDWQRLPPSVRAHLPALWAGASNAARSRFARHLRSYWDISLHRAPPESAAVLDGLIQNGRLKRYKGRVTSLDHAPSGRVALKFRPRAQSAIETFSADFVLNALGNEFDWTQIDRPLEKNLLRRGLVAPHATRYGIDALAQTGQVVGADGRASDHLFAVGHPLRGVSWESSAISEQLIEATLVAKRLVTPAVAELALA